MGCGSGRRHTRNSRHWFTASANPRLAPNEVLAAAAPVLTRSFGFDPIYNATVRHEWRCLTHELGLFSQLRKQHHARMNRNRRGEARSLEFRQRCLNSPIGQRIDAAGLFAECFDSAHLIPTEIAAKVLHAERKQQMIVQEAGLRERAQQTLSDQSREVYLAQATKVAARLQRHPSWRTLYRKLKADR